MATTNLGAVGISAGGVYDSETVYKKYKVVSANGGSYMYINPTPAAGVPVTDTSHWQQIASIGGQDLVDAAVAARNAAQAQAVLAQGYAAQLAAGVASPKGTYADLVALNAGTPTVADVNEIYITLDDGKWCYHNGTEWVAGEVYQAASVVGDIASINSRLADIAIDGIYPFPITWERGLINTTTGIDGNNSNSVRTIGMFVPDRDYIAKLVFGVSGPWFNVLTYDENGAYVGSVSKNVDSGIRLTAGTKYRFSIYSSSFIPLDDIDSVVRFGMPWSGWDNGQTCRYVGHLWDKSISFVPIGDNMKILIGYDMEIISANGLKENYATTGTWTVPNNSVLYIDLSTKAVGVAVRVSVPVNAFVLASVYQGSVIDGYLKPEYIKFVRGTNKTCLFTSHQGFPAIGKTSGYCIADNYAVSGGKGFDYCEGDLRFSADGIPVLCHDATFVDATSSETVTIATTTYADLITHNYYGSTIATLEEVLAICKRYGMGFVCDQFTNADTSDKRAAVYGIIKKYGMEDHFLFGVYTTMSTDVDAEIKAWYAKANFMVIATDAANIAAATARANGLYSGNNNVYVGVMFDSDGSTTNVDAVNSATSVGVKTAVWTIDVKADILRYIPRCNMITSNKFSFTDL